MIFPRERCIHVHVPKTAGQSIRVFLGPGVPNAERFPVGAADAGPLGTHFTAEEMRSHDPEGLWGDYFTFALARNPWDRAESEFLWRKSRQGLRRDFESLESFLREAIKGWDFQEDDARHVLPQTAFILSPSGEVLVDHVGRYETIDSDMETICGRIGVAFRDFPRVNVSDSARRVAGDLWNAETRRLVVELWGDDIDYFGYEFPHLAGWVAGATLAVNSATVPRAAPAASTGKPIVYLHIGHGKTGSTTIQCALRVQADEIRAQGLLIADGDLRFPESGPVERHPLLPLKRLMAHAPTAEAEAELERALEVVAERCRSGAFRGAVISSENLSQPAGARLFASLADRFDLRVIYYVRRQDGWIESGWKQWGIKSGQMLADYARLQTESGQPDYLSRARLWREVVADLRVVPLEGVENVVADFWQWLELTDLEPPDVPPQNRTYDWSVLEILSRNPWLFDNVQDNRIFNLLERLLPDAAPRDGHGLLDSELAGRIMDRHREANLALRDEFFPDRPPLQDYQAFHFRNTDRKERSDSEATFRFLGQLLGILASMNAKDQDFMLTPRIHQWTSEIEHRATSSEESAAQLAVRLDKLGKRLEKSEVRSRRLLEENKDLRRRLTKVESATKRTFSSRLTRWIGRLRHSSRTP